MGIPIPIYYSYKYRDYPEAPELTKKSKTAGSLTSWPMGLFVFFILGAVLGGVLESGIGLDQDTAYGIGMLTAVVAVPLILRKVRKSVFEKLDGQYMEKLRQWQSTDPQRYLRAAQELQRRQNTK